MGVCLCNYSADLEPDQNQPVKKMMVISSEKNMHLRQREGKTIWRVLTALSPARGLGHAMAK